MADYLDPVVATFLAEADKYLGPVRDMRTAALEAAKANDTLAESIVRLDDVMTDMAGPAAAAAGRINDVRNAAAGAAGADESLARESEAAGHAMAGAALGAEAMAHETSIAGDAVGELGGDFEMMSRFAMEARERLNNASAAIDAIGAQSKAAARCSPLPCRRRPGRECTVGWGRPGLRVLSESLAPGRSARAPSRRI